MKRTLIAMVLFTLSSAICRAEGEPTITHNFASMSSASTLAWPVNYKTGVTDDVTYSCTGTSSTFGVDHVNGTTISITMSKADDVITLSPALEGLTKFEIYFYPTNAKRTNIEVYVSTDGVNWGDAVSGDNRSDSNGLIRIKDLPRNDYRVQIRNKTATAISIFEMRYYQSSCRCLRVVSE